MAARGLVRNWVLVLVVPLCLSTLGAVPPRVAGSDLGRGRMLVATRQVGGPFFAQSVVLLMDHSRTKGAAGLIVNRRSKLALGTLVEDLGESGIAKTRIHLGGPVTPESIQVVWRTPTPPKGARHILADLYVSGRVEILQHLRDRGTPAEEVRAYVGYSGWSPGQLENEIARGDWIVTRGDPKLVFHENPDALWPELIRAHEGLQAFAPATTTLAENQRERTER